MSRKVQTPVFRASYCNLGRPKQTQNGAWCYDVTMIFDPEELRKPENKRLWDDMMALMEETKRARWPNGDPKTGVISPFRRGAWKTAENQLGFDLEKNPEYEGMIIAGARAYTTDPDTWVGKVDPKAPGIIGPNKARIDGSEVYSGCYARAILTMYVPKIGDAKVALGLEHIQKCYDGEPLGTNRGNPEDQFESFMTPEAEGSHDDLLGV